MTPGGHYSSHPAQLMTSQGFSAKGTTTVESLPHRQVSSQAANVPLEQRDTSPQPPCRGHQCYHSQQTLVLQTKTRYYTAQPRTGHMALGKSRHTLSLTSLHSVTQMSGGGQLRATTCMPCGMPSTVWHGGQKVPELARVLTTRSLSQFGKQEQEKEGIGGRGLPMISPCKAAA